MTIASPTDPQLTSSRWYRVAAALPDRVLQVFLAACLSVGLAATFDAVFPWIVLPLFVVALVVLWRTLPPLVEVTKSWAVGSLAAIGATLLWIAGNVPFASQLFHVTRDPGVYTVLGVAIANDGTPDLDVAAAQSASTGLPLFSADLGSFGATGGVVQLQGGDLLPGILAVFNWIFGLHGLVVANIVLGGIALLAVYGLARRLVGPWWAIMPQATLALTVGFIYIARAPYSEIIMAAVCAAGMTWLIVAVRTGSRRLYAVAGLFTGVSGFARVDAPIAVIGTVAVLGFLSLGFFASESRRQVLRGSVLFLATSILGIGLGYLQLALNKPRYLSDLGNQTLLLGGAVMGAVVVLGMIVLGTRLLGVPQVGPKAVRRWAVMLASAVAAVFAFWLSRPLWFVAHHQADNAATMSVIEGLQAREGLPLDGTRSYEELTLSWIAWYIGWPGLIVGIAGIVLLVYVAVSRRRAEQMLFVGTALAVAALYFTQVSITPDQPWAIRRFIPIVMPLFVIASAWMVRFVWERTSGMRGRLIVVVASVLLAASPLTAWNHLLLVTEGSGQLSEIQAVCDSLESDIVVLARTGAPANYALSLRAVCDVQVLSEWDATPTDFEALYERTGPIDVVFFAQDSVIGGSAFTAPAHSGIVRFWDNRLAGLPQTHSSSLRDVWVGVLDADGSIVPR